MKTRPFLTIAMIANLIYGCWYFLAPQGAANAYGFGAATTELSNLIFQFLGIMFIAEGVMCAVARQAENSLGRIAVLAFISISSLLCFYMDIKTLLGEPGTLDYIDTVVNALFGFGALTILIRDRKTQMPH
ncbi:MAG: hypothetical protein KA257_01430 [Opitutaceae bacterium]|nr:hypothetical protein [Opitutaceae bacterium]MBP9913527.1 hypothetical protein [Opitutaceae bacterium]